MNTLKPFSCMTSLRSPVPETPLVIHAITNIPKEINSKLKVKLQNMTYRNTKV